MRPHDIDGTSARPSPRVLRHLQAWQPLIFMAHSSLTPMRGLRVAWLASAFLGIGGLYRFLSRFPSWECSSSKGAVAGWCSDSFELDPGHIHVWLVVILTLGAVLVPRMVYVRRLRRGAASLAGESVGEPERHREKLGSPTLAWFGLGYATAFVLFVMSLLHSNVRLISCHDATVVQCPCFLNPMETLMCVVGGALVLASYMPMRTNVLRWTSRSH